MTERCGDAKVYKCCINRETKNRHDKNTQKKTHPFGAGVNDRASGRRRALVHVLGLEAAAAV